MSDVALATSACVAEQVLPFLLQNQRGQFCSQLSRLPLAAWLFSIMTSFSGCYQDILYRSAYVVWRDGMSWRLVEVRDQRVEFVVRLSRGEGMRSLFREFG